MKRTSMNMCMCMMDRMSILFVMPVSCKPADGE